MQVKIIFCAHSAAKAKSITISCGVLKTVGEGSGCRSVHLMYEQSEHLTLALSERRVFVATESIFFDLSFKKYYHCKKSMCVIGAGA